MAGIDHEKLAGEAKAMAQSHLIQMLFTELFSSSAETDAYSRRLLDQCERICDVVSWDHLDPATSDLAAQMLRDELIGPLVRARSLVLHESFDRATIEKNWRLQG